jgi:hypothetical protein
LIHQTLDNPKLINPSDALNDLKQNFSMLQAMYEEACKEQLTIKESSDNLRKKMHALQEEQYGMKDCMNCHESFTPLLNDEVNYYFYLYSLTLFKTSCSYHHGRLKYYSCRGCGADEYFSCCNRCKQCLKGCRTGKHVPKV